MNWRNPLFEQPEEGAVVWVLMKHWKNHGAQSCEIFAGEYSELRTDEGEVLRQVLNLDYIGHGSATWDFPADEYQHTDCNYVFAWLPAEEIEVPKF